MEGAAALPLLTFAIAQVCTHMTWVMSHVWHASFYWRIWIALYHTYRLFHSLLLQLCKCARTYSSHVAWWIKSRTNMKFKIKGVAALLFLGFRVVQVCTRIKPVTSCIWHASCHAYDVRQVTMIEWLSSTVLFWQARIFMYEWPWHSKINLILNDNRFMNVTELKLYVKAKRCHHIQRTLLSSIIAQKCAYIT